MKSNSVLIIYTGGTIGMVNDPQTGVLCPFDFDQITKAVPEIKEFEFAIDSYILPEIIDSSDLKPDLWVKLCQIILDEYDKYGGFVILHGTDTMAYSASALSFMLHDLTKPVVFTGSQLPIGTIRTDGRENLITALEIAAATIEGKAIVPEVCVLFGDKLLRGNRTTKINAERFDAFHTFNYPPLAEIGIHIHYNHGAINNAPRLENITASLCMDTHIAVLYLFPGIQIGLIDSIINSPGIKGVILATFGSGNAPTDPSFLEKIKEATTKGIIIYNITQCKGGAVEMGRYKTSKELTKHGVISGYDITLEAAICKLMHVLGDELGANETKKYLNSSIKGEITEKHVWY